MRVLIGRDEMPRRRFTARLLWEPRDIWLGVFWNTVRAGGPRDRFLLVYVSVLPCLPVAISWRLGAGADSRSASSVAPDGPVSLERHS